MHFHNKDSFFTRLTTTTRDQMPPLFQEFNIFTGYRLIHQSWRYYWLSGVQFHNETLNVWTHLGGGLLIAWQLWQLYAEFWDTEETAGKSLSMATLFTLSSLALHVMSSLAHLLHSKSELAHCVLFFCDNAAAGMVAFSMNFINFFFQSTRVYYQLMCPYFLPVQIIGSLMLSSCYSYALAKYRRRYNLFTVLLMFGPTGSYMLWGSLPFLYKVYSYWWYGGDMDGLTASEYFQWLHFNSLALFLLSAVFYLSNFPERLWPGKFDIIGHSHQWFHVFASLSHVVHLRAVAHDLRHDHPHLYHKRSGISLTVADVAMSLYTVLLVNCCVCVYLRHAFAYSSGHSEKRALSCSDSRNE